MTPMKKMTAAVLLAAALGACSDLPEDTAPSRNAAATAIMRAPFAPLDPGSYEQVSLHFLVRAYGADQARRISDQAEAFYQTIMQDTNLYSFMPSGLYEIVVYGSHEEYVAKTKQPAWSGGVAYGNAIYSFNDAQLNQTIAHEMTHLVFNEFMERSRPDLLWLNEGLAVYEQGKAASGKSVPADIFGQFHAQVRAQPIALEEMLSFVPLSEKTEDPKVPKVTLWYAQAESMTQYLVERGGRIGVSQFLQALKDGKGFDQAIGSSFVGIWNDLPGFYQAWKSIPQ